MELLTLLNHIAEVAEARAIVAVQTKCEDAIADQFWRVAYSAKDLLAEETVIKEIMEGVVA